MNIFSRKKVTKKDIVLELLLDFGEMTPLEIIEASKGGVGRGTVYNILTRLKLDGYLDSRDGTGPAKFGGLPQRFYRISNHGRRVINVHRMRDDVPCLDASLATA